MRAGWRVVFAAALALVPGPALAQADVVFPAPGAESSYRRTTIAWLPVPGAGSYHLQVDDDPAFGSPEVDVIVAEPELALHQVPDRNIGYRSYRQVTEVGAADHLSAVRSPSSVEPCQSPAASHASNRRVSPIAP